MAVTTDAPPIDELLARVRRELRLRRAERGALRGGFWGAVAAVVLLAAQGLLGGIALPLAIGVVCLGAAGGALFAACRRVTGFEAARLADQALGLQDRVATSLELASRPDRGPFFAALVADTAARVAQIGPRRMLARTLPREARLLPLPLAAAAALALLPPVPGVGSWLPAWLGGGGTDQADWRSPTPENRVGPLARDAPRRLAQDPFARTLPQKTPADAVESAGLFKDKALAAPRADFASFLKKGDDRLRMLANTDRLPDLRSDFTSSKYQALLRQARELSSGGRRQNISPRKLADLLKEMERLGKQGGNWEDEVQRGLEAVEDGLYDDALDAMENALDKLRDLEDRQRSRRSLQGGREPQSGSPVDGSFRFGDEPGANDPERPGATAGFGSNPNSRGRPTARLRSTPYTSGVQGVRRGRNPGYESQLGGNAASPAAGRPLAGEIGRYRRMMEDAIAREQVPRDYHEQIRDYFRSLDEH
jgi:hypothetical protein